GNITRLRNLEYMAAAVGGRSFVVSETALSSRAESGDLVLCGRLSSCFQENKPLSRNTSSGNSFFKRSRRRKPESGAKPMRKVLIDSSSNPRPIKYSRAFAPSGRLRHS